MAEEKGLLAEILVTGREAINRRWMEDLAQSGIRRTDLMSEAEVREQCDTLLRLLGDAASSGSLLDAKAMEFSHVRDFLSSVSRTRAQQGFSPRETSLFVMALKRPIFEQLRVAAGARADVVAEEMWKATLLIDELSILTIESYMRGREEVIARQQQELLELSTPVVKLWDGVLALPMIGTLDSARTQIVMEALLVKIVETGSEIAILDITGVPTVDTLVAQHLLKTVAAARLMGAECIISGIRPQIAQTIVHLGVDLKDVVTKATLADAFVLALQRLGRSVDNPN
jgi:rsbT co-antagonist protein RsbR